METLTQLLSAITIIKQAQSQQRRPGAWKERLASQEEILGSGPGKVFCFVFGGSFFLPFPFH